MALAVMTTTPPGGRKRRRFGLSVRALMLLVLVCGAWAGRRVDRMNAERRAVAAVLALLLLRIVDVHEIAQAVGRADLRLIPLAIGSVFLLMTLPYPPRPLLREMPMLTPPIWR